MSREDAITVEGTVIDVLRETLFRVELPNRHRVLAHAARRAGSAGLRLSPGDTVSLEMSPYDLSKGRIVLEQRPG